MRRTALLLLLLIAIPGVTLFAQQTRDPLSQDEIDQIRNSAIHPVDRVKLYMKFIEQRMDEIKKTVSNPNATKQDRVATLRDKMEEVTRLCDELQDDLDTFDSAHADIRKPLKDLVPQSARWTDTLNLAAVDPSYDFSRQTAIEATKSTNEEAKKLIADQDRYFAQHKEEHGQKGAGPS